MKLLMSMNASVAAVPPPLTDDEVVERLARLMKSASAKLCRAAYRRAYPLRDRVPMYDQEEIADLGVFIKGKILGLKTLKQFNAMFPEVAKVGSPQGFPTGGGAEAQMEWVQQAATKIFIERRRKQIAAEAARIRAEDRADGDEVEPEDVAGPGFELRD
jgi:hypothetical protein